MLEWFGLVREYSGVSERSWAFLEVHLSEIYQLHCVFLFPSSVPHAATSEHL